MASTQNPADEQELEFDEEGAGARLGLALVFGLGFLIGGLTSVGLWICYPPSHADWWRIPVVMAVSVVLLLTFFTVLRRRAGQRAGDWFVLGYLGAFLLYVGVLGAQATVQFIRDHVASSIGASA